MLRYPLLFFLMCWAFGLQAAHRNPFSVVVIGGGPAGLATAIVAKQQGAQVTVVEKYSQRTRSQGIMLFDSSLKLLESWGVACPQKVNQDAPVALIPLRNLEKSLMERSEELGIKILCGKFQGMKNRQAEIVTEDGTTIYLPYDILVGADGAHSLVRERLGIEVNQYASAVGAVAIMEKPKSTDFSIYTSKPGGFYLRRIKAASLSILFAQSVLDSVDRIPSELFAKLAKDAGCEEEGSLIEEARVQTFVERIEITLQQALTFAHEKHQAILVGDAAATGSFFDGMGANTALKSASLAGQFMKTLQRHKKKAFLSFNEAMKETTNALIEKSRYLFE